MSFGPDLTSARARDELGHPVIDIDGHVIEFMPVVLDFLREELSAGDFQRFLTGSQIAQRSPAGARPPAEVRESRLPRRGWWQFPAGNTTDRATGMLPSLLHQRLPDFGIDFTVLYPTICLGSAAIDDEDLRRGVCRGYNRFCAEVFRPYGDRITAAGVVPMDTPEEAISELRHCKTIGLKVVAIPHGVQRRLRRPQSPEGRHGIYRRPPKATWFDSFGLDSAFDYDPVWAAFVDLGFAVTSHHGLSWYDNTYTSITNYSHNHLGSHAEAMAMLCKAMYMGGVLRRFPQLSVGFLECGVGWAAILLANVIEHWEKRNLEACASRDPGTVDVALLTRLFRHHAAPAVLARDNLADELSQSLLYSADAPEQRDDWIHLGVETAADLAIPFQSNFFFGCEADDTTIAFAFASGNPFGSHLQPCFSSDIGHWDVSDMAAVVTEAYGLAVRGILTPEELRAFLFSNPARLHLRANPGFFAGTAVERATGEAVGDPEVTTARA